MSISPPPRGVLARPKSAPVAPAAAPPRALAALAIPSLLLATTPALAQSAAPVALPTLVVEAPARKPARPKPTVRKAAVRKTIAAATRDKPRDKPSDAPPAAGTGAAAPRPSSAPPPILSRWSPTTAAGGPAFVERLQLPNPSVASITRREISEKINAFDTQDTIKYFPGLFVRKRNIGDTQSVIQSRTWGVGSSARTLVYADDLLLTALIGNDNTIGAPRWGLVSPEEIERVDFLYGPFSAAYPGNSMGGVLQITTRMPEKLEVAAKQTEAVQTFSLWGTNKSYWTHISSASAGDKTGDLSWFVAGNLSSNRTQPLSYVTTAQSYPWAGLVAGQTKVGATANILGAGGQLDQFQAGGKVKLAYDISSWLRATWQTGFWSNDSSTQPESWIGGFGGRSGASALAAATLQSFGASYYRVQEQTLANSAALKSATNGPIDFELSASHFAFLKYDQLNPWSALAPSGYTPAGKDTRYGGVNWALADAKFFWRPEFYGKHEVSFGAHFDRYRLNNPVWLTTNWTQGMAAASVPSSMALGSTRTAALWVQDAWRLNSAFKATLGGRQEYWRASGGYNQSLSGIAANGLWAATPANLASGAPIHQPERSSARFSPKASLQWTPDEAWTVTGAIGMANRFPTVRELYNLATSTGTISNPNPNLRPETALTEEIAVERKIGTEGSVRLSLFNEEVRDAIISQNIYIAGTTTSVSNVANVDKVRNRGAEVAFRKDNFLIDRFELSGSATFVDSRILADSSWAGGTAGGADLWNFSPVGKNAPQVPKWRWTLVGVYRPDDHWSFTAAARWQGRMWSTMSNNDIVHGVYQSFDRFFVVDTKIDYKLGERANFAFGVDNVGNAKYFLFHPFPQRTFTLSGRFKLGAERFDDIGLFRPSGAGAGVFEELSRDLFARL